MRFKNLQQGDLIKIKKLIDKNLYLIKLPVKIFDGLLNTSGLVGFVIDTKIGFNVGLISISVQYCDA